MAGNVCQARQAVQISNYICSVSQHLDPNPNPEMCSKQAPSDDVITRLAVHLANLTLGAVDYSLLVKIGVTWHPSLD